jgi:hypothetical protein
VIQTLRRELPIIVFIIPPTTPREVLGIDAQAVVAAVAHHVIPGQNFPVHHAVGQAVGVDLFSRDP